MARLRRGIATTAVMLAATLGVAACAPDPGTGGPSWKRNGLTRIDSDTELTNMFGAWTSEDYFVSVRAKYNKVDGQTVQPPEVGLEFYARSGSGGKDLLTPQVIPITFGPTNFNPILGESFIALAGVTSVNFFAESAGVWSPAGTFPLDNAGPNVASAEYLVALNDDWMILQNRPTDEYGVSTLDVYAVTQGPGGISATYNSTISPDPAMNSYEKSSFGRLLSLDGDILAISSWDHFDGPGGTRIYRPSGGTWQLDQVISDVPGSPAYDGPVAVDDGPTVDRVVVHRTDYPESFVEVYADSGAGFILEQQIAPPALPDEQDGEFWGISVGIDGDLLAVGARTLNLASATPGHAPTLVGTVDMFRFGTSWTHEKSVIPATDPVTPMLERSMPWALQVVGNHVAVTQVVNFDPPPNCGFFCFNLGGEAWDLTKG